MLDFIFKHKRMLTITALLIATAIIAVSVFFVAKDRTNSATIKITVSPLSAKIKIGEKECDSVSDCKVAPGEYDVLISADGFISQTTRIAVSDNESIELATFLEPTEDNANWYEDHQQDAVVRGDIMSDASIKKYYDLKEVEPILNYVPYNTYTYSIGYEENCTENNQKLCLILKGDFGTANVAIEYLQSTGQELSRYILKYDSDRVFENAEISISDSLEPKRIDGTTDLTADISKIRNTVKNFASNNLVSNEYGVEVLQIKSYGDFCGVKTKVFKTNGDENIYDTYKIILYKINDIWQPITNPEIILSKYTNEKIPTELLKEVNAW